MVRIPGFAVGLFGLVAVFVAFGLIQLTRYFLRPLLQLLATILRVIPLVGGFLSREVLKGERIVDSWLGSAALHTEQLATGWLHGWTTLFARLGTEIAGLAADTYRSTLGLVRVTIPRLLRAAETRLLRLIRVAEARVAALGRSIASQARALGVRIARLERTIQTTILRELGEAKRFAIAEAALALHEARVGIDYLRRAAEAAEHRIGQLEHAVTDGVWGELRRLGDDLRPDRLIERLLAYVWGLVPGEVRLFFEWIWHLLVESAEFLEALVSGEWPGPTTHASMRDHLEAVARDSKAFAQSLHDELHGR